MRNQTGLAVLAVLLAVLNYASIANAQAYYGTVQREIQACGSDNFISLGCFKDFLASVQPTYFQFDPQGYLPSDPSRSFPGWSPGSNYNSTVTGLDCARACRGFGYKFAAMRDNSCRCGIQLPTGYNPTQDAVCQVTCNGNNNQTCGGGQDAQIYVDPSFAANGQVPILMNNPSIAQYYQHMGCFYSPNGFPSGDSRATFTVPSIDECFSRCAGLGYPLVAGITDSYGSGFLYILRANANMSQWPNSMLLWNNLWLPVFSSTARTPFHARGLQHNMHVKWKVSTSWFKGRSCWGAQS
ncbi:WSC domain-containing protein [Apiosordaria backusii]|uniref:WSC domain-containing protein n=1 Tax=Apiosordaria backusii TaxID=314023 RepID=A0AA40AN79_9PEZI|nr:WSC domain-containing protein [Apiosordaria backusii]